MKKKLLAIITSLVVLGGVVGFANNKSDDQKADPGTGTKPKSIVVPTEEV